MDRTDQILERLGSIESLLIRQVSPWLTVMEAAAYLKLSPRSVRRYLSKGSIPQHGWDGTIRIAKRDLDALLLYGKPWKKLISRQREELKTRDL